MNNYEKYFENMLEMKPDELKEFLDDRNIDTTEDLMKWFSKCDGFLTDSEKQYLKNVIEPFKNRVQYIYKTYVDYMKTQYAIIIIAKYREDYSNSFSITLEPFPFTSTAFIGMDLNYDYTLEELGLDE